MNRIEDCEPFRNKDILITRDQAVKLNPDENFIATDWPESADGRG